MGTLTLLAMMNQVLDELALPAASAIMNSNDDQIRQLRALAQREGRFTSQLSFGSQNGWQIMRKLATFTLHNGQEAYAVPSDVDHFITNTWWDVAYKWQLAGPLSPQEWDVLKYGISPAGPRKRFRILGGQLNIDPIPGSADEGLTAVAEYISNAWCQSAASALQTKWTADTDTYLLDDDTMVMGVKWRFLRAKGLDYDEEKDQWWAQIQQAQAKDGADRYLPTNAQARNDVNLLTSDQVPDTGFGT